MAVEDLVTMPSLLYGTSPSASFCPVRDVSFVCAQLYPAVLQWLVIAAESHLATRRGLPPPASLIRRKVEAYKALNDIVNDVERQYSDEALTGIIAAIAVDSRIAGPEVTRTHLKGLDMLIRGRGNLKSLSDTMLLMFNPLFYVGVHHLCESEVADLREL